VVAGLAVAATLATTRAPALHAQEVTVGSNVRVTTGLEARPLVEPHLAIHPRDPRHLLGATIVGDARGAFEQAQYCAAFLSTDGGATWKRHDFPITGCGDPWVAIAPDGGAVFTALGNHAGLTQQGTAGIVVFHSTDGGRTWEEKPVGLGRGHDHQTVAVDQSSRRKGWMYLVSGQGIRGDEGKLRWSVYVARSIDGGATFNEPVKVVPSNLNINAEVPVVLSDGTLVVSFIDFQRNVDGFTKDGRLDRSREWVLRSVDGGQTFSTPLFVTEKCAAGWTWLAADTSASPFRDRVYHVCRRREGDAIVLTYSADGGEQWSESSSIHAVARDSSVAPRQPQVAVNRNGVVGVTGLESRDRARPRCLELFFSASLDGGRTFLPERKVSTAPSCPDSALNGMAYARWPSGGDYYGLVAAPDGRFHAFWPDARERGVFQLWAAPIEVAGKAAGLPEAVAIGAEPRHHIRLANEDVRVFDVVVPPNDTTLYHHHEVDYAYVTLGDARLVGQALGAEPSPLVIADGEVRFTRGPIKHRVSNPSPTPFHNVTIELLRRGSTNAALPSPAPGDSVVLENDRVRAVRRTVAPGSTVTLRYPGGRALDVFVDRGVLDETASGATRSLEVEPGTFAWQGEGSRTLRNTGGRPLRVVTLYMK
jgi:hypothetical protein